MAYALSLINKYLEISLLPYYCPILNQLIVPPLIRNAFKVEE